MRGAEWQSRQSPARPLRERGSGRKCPAWDRVREIYQEEGAAGLPALSAQLAGRLHSGSLGLGALLDQLIGWVCGKMLSLVLIM